MKTIVIRKPGATSGANINMSPIGAPRSADGFELAGAAPDAAPDIEVMDLDEDERREIESQPDTTAVDAIPLTIVKPPALGEFTDDDCYVACQDGASNEATWGVAAVNADKSPYTGEMVSVAVLDTGIDKSHPAFADPTLRIVTKNFTDDVDEDTHGHGTHCAGTIFGRAVNGKRIGVAPGVTTAFIGKVLPGTTAELIDAMSWVMKNNAMVLSMSLGFDFRRMIEILQDHYGIPRPAAISRGLTAFRANIEAFDAVMQQYQARMLSSHGTVVVAASGNESERNAQPKPYTIAASPPSAAFGVISVGALQQKDDEISIASFSNTHVQVAAPGVAVMSARAGGTDLRPMSGTSMACPHVAGLAALYWEKAINDGDLPKASAISAKLNGRARRNSAWNVLDVGNGLPTAPLE